MSIETELAQFKQREQMGVLVDERLERALRDREPLEPTLRDMLPAVLTLLNARYVAVRTTDETLTERTFALGDPPTAALAERLATADVSGALVVEADFIVFPIDVAGDDFGRVIVLASTTWESPEHIASLVNTFAETLDNHLDALREPVLDIGLDRAIEVIRSEVKFDSLLIAFRHEDDVRGASMRYRILRSDGSCLDSRTPTDPKTGAAIRVEALDFLDGRSRDLLDRLGIERFREEVLIHGVRDQRIHTHDRELLDRFADALRQRIVDYNREWKVLSQSFPLAVVDRLLAEEDYVARYLKPTVHDVAILYADISGFSRISEQVLVDPRRIGALIDLWGERVCQLIWDEGGVFDKMVGDCVIAFFGPPLHEMTPKDCCERALRAARAIREFTATLDDGVALPELRGLTPPIGVATGVNFGALCVGVFGPDEDYTGFSSGMNNTARLQGVATRDEILVMDTVVGHVGDGFTFGEEQGAKVKNVAEPLRYRPLID